MPPVTSICQPDLGRIDAACQKSLAALLAERNADGYWTGELSSSALATATAISALGLVQKQTDLRSHDQLIANGLAWLAAHQNADGGWGDTVKSFSNISTSMLCRAALHLVGQAARLSLEPARTRGHPPPATPHQERCGLPPTRPAGRNPPRTRHGPHRCGPRLT